MMHGAAVAKMGGLHYLKSLWPHIDVPVIGPVLSFVIWLIELMGTVIKSGVLAIRLFANMFAGHMVLATILTFIVLAGEAVNAGRMNVGLWSVITVSSVLGVVALSLLEVLVAFIQAYIFVFLTSLFMGMALHPQH
jgi:F-type H+-transporting ATPase subunit a